MHEGADIGSLEIGEVIPENLTQLIRLAELIWWDHFPGIISNEQIVYMLSKGYTN